MMHLPFFAAPPTGGTSPAQITTFRPNGKAALGRKGRHDRRVVDALKEDNLLLAIKFYHAAHNCDTQAAREAILAIKGRLGV